MTHHLQLKFHQPIFLGWNDNNHIDINIDKLTQLKIPITDYTNGFRIYSKDSIKHIVANCGKIGGGFIILSEILVELYFNNFKVKEVHSIFKNRIRGESSVNFRLIIESFFGLFKVYKKKKEIINKIS